MAAIVTNCSENLAPPSNLQARFFVALLPPAEIQAYANRVIQDLTQRYRTRTSHSPPHITLQPPFLFAPERLSALIASLQHFANEQAAVPVFLSNFAAFAPRVLYLNVVKTPELLALQAALSHRLVTDGIIDASQQEQRPFVPHLTVASRNMTRQIFRQAWLELQTQTVEFQFMAEQLTLLIYVGQRWQIQAEFHLTKQ
jgi:2'-5' RNA ligase